MQRTSNNEAAFPSTWGRAENRLREEVQIWTLQREAQLWNPSNWFTQNKDSCIFTTLCPLLNIWFTGRNKMKVSLRQVLLVPAQWRCTLSRAEMPDHLLRHEKIRPNKFSSLLPPDVSKAQRCCPLPKHCHYIWITAPYNIRNTKEGLPWKKPFLMLTLQLG